MLESEGYPFKSKHHADTLARFARNGMTKWIERYYKGMDIYGAYRCPNILKYQFEEPLPFRISDKCCDRLKKDPIHRFEKERHKLNAIIAVRSGEGGRRATAKCLAFQDNRLHFQPFAVITEEWIDWYIAKRNIQLCKLYYPPYNFTRTGCKGCPFAKDLQHNLDVLEEFFPKERKQCELLWKPVYDEYRRIGYRLKPLQPEHQINLDEWEAKQK